MLRPDDTYIFGESLTVTLSNTNNQYLIETANAKIEKGGCDGRRVANKNNVIVVMPSPTSSETPVDVSIWAGWAEGHSAVSVTDVLVLKAPSTHSLPKTLSHRSKGLHAVNAKTMAKKEEVAEEEEDGEEHEMETVKVMKARGRMTSTHTVQRRKAKVDPQDLTADTNLRGNKPKDYISSKLCHLSVRLLCIACDLVVPSTLIVRILFVPSDVYLDIVQVVTHIYSLIITFTGVDTPSVFEPRHGKRAYDAKSAPSINTKTASTSARTGRVKAVLADSKLSVEEVRKMSKQKDSDGTGKTKAKGPAAVGDYLRHITLTTFEWVVVGAILLVFVATLGYQICSGKFGFQLSKHIYKLRGGKQYAE